MHCDAFPSLSLKLSPSLRGLCWRRAPLRPGGQPAFSPAEEHGPSDSLIFLGICACRETFWSVTDAMS
jgi:hypothetical protein